MMENAINEFNEEPEICNINKKTDEIYNWVIGIN